MTTCEQRCDRCDDKAACGCDCHKPARLPGRSFVGRVVDSGGGQVRMLVRRDTELYPPEGADAVVTWEPV